MQRPGKGNAILLLLFMTQTISLIQVTHRLILTSRMIDYGWMDRQMDRQMDRRACE